jgi:hypothetical protein
MPIWQGDVTITRTWEGVEVEAEDEEDALSKFGSMKEEELSKSVIADESVDVEALECIDCEEEEEEDE